MFRGTRPSRTIATWILSPLVFQSKAAADRSIKECAIILMKRVILDWVYVCTCQAHPWSSDRTDENARVPRRTQTGTGRVKATVGPTISETYRWKSSWETYQASSSSITFGTITMSPFCEIKWLGDIVGPNIKADSSSKGVVFGWAFAWRSADTTRSASTVLKRVK